MENVEGIIAIVIAVGLTFYFIYLVLKRRKTPQEALDEIHDLADQAKEIKEDIEDLLEMTKTDLFMFDAEKLKEICGRLGLPPSSGKEAPLVDQIWGELEKVRESN